MFLGVSKVLISWRYHTFHTRRHHPKILYSHTNEKSVKFINNPRFLIHRSDRTIIAVNLVGDLDKWFGEAISKPSPTPPTRRTVNFLRYLHGHADGAGRASVYERAF